MPRWTPAGAPMACSRATTWWTSRPGRPMLPSFTRCSKARSRCCPAAICRWPSRFRCWTRCLPARCSRPGATASCSIPTASCRASCSATNSTPPHLPCRWCRRCWPAAAATCCSSKATAWCALPRRWPTGTTWKPPAPTWVQTCCRWPRLTSVCCSTTSSPAVRARCSLLRAWAVSTGTWWPSCCWRCKSGCSTQPISKPPNCRHWWPTTGVCVMAWATARALPLTAPSRPTPTATRQVRAAPSNRA